MRALVCFFAVTLLTPLSFAVTIGQTDDFSGGTTQNWIVNLLGMGSSHPAPPQNVPDGGPGGAGDNFLRLTSIGGGGPGSRLSSLNLGQWTGDYLAAGVNAISMDVRNSGGTDLYIRMLFEAGSGGPPTDAAITNAVFVPAGSGWQSILLTADPASVTSLLGSVNAALSQTSTVRILHGEAAEFPPAPVVGLLDIDNITAAQIPEPATFWLAGGALAVALLRRRFGKAVC